MDFITFFVKQLNYMGRSSNKDQILQFGDSLQRSYGHKHSKIDSKNFQSIIKDERYQVLLNGINETLHWYQASS